MRSIVTNGHLPPEIVVLGPTVVASSSIPHPSGPRLASMSRRHWGGSGVWPFVYMQQPGGWAEQSKSARLESQSLRHHEAHLAI